MPSRDLVALRGLLERVEAAKGLDRGLFCGIGEALMGDLDANTWCRVLRFVEAEAWTDAALALVERVLPGWEIDISIGSSGAGYATMQGPGFSDQDMSQWAQGEVRKLPLAILDSTLQALIAQEERADGR